MQIAEEGFLAARAKWYALMGWTPEGVPTEERLGALGLSELLG